MAHDIQCRNCGVPTLSEAGLCHACYQYRWRTGLPRPVENAVLARMRAVKEGGRC